jgi:Glycosyl transferase family 41
MLLLHCCILLTFLSLDAAASLAPPPPPPLNDRMAQASALASQGNIVGARALLDDDSRCSAHAKCAHLLAQLFHLHAPKEYDKALEYYNVASTLTPSWSLPLRNAAELLIDASRLRAALDYLIRASNPSDGEDGENERRVVLDFFQLPDLASGARGLFVELMLGERLLASERWRNEARDAVLGAVVERQWIDASDGDDRFVPLMSAPNALLLYDDGRLARVVDAHVRVWQHVAERNGDVQRVRQILGDGDAPRQQRQRHRVGYLSSAFAADNPMAHVIDVLLDFGNRDRVELVCLWIRPTHVIDKARLDHIAVACCDSFVEVHSDVSAAAEQLAALHLDAIVHMSAFFSLQPLVARPAPLQIAWLGWPSSTRAPFIDYAVVDRHVAADEARFTESLIVLPDSVFASVDAHRHVALGRRMPPPRSVAAERAAVFGAGTRAASASALVLINQGMLYKLDADTVHMWARLLLTVDESVLVLLRDPHDTADNVWRAFEALGVARERIVMVERVSHERYVQRLQLADVYLDTPAYNGGATALGVMWAGLPAVTLSGARYTQRMFASILDAMRAPQCVDALVTHSPDSYAAEALKLMRDADYRRTVRRCIESARHTAPLFNPALFAEHFERAIVAAIERGGAPAKPITLIVPQDTSAPVKRRTRSHVAGYESHY